MADDVVGREALSFVQFGRLQHLQAGIDDHIGRAFDGHLQTRHWLSAWYVDG